MQFAELKARAQDDTPAANPWGRFGRFRRRHHIDRRLRGGLHVGEPRHDVFDEKKHAIWRLLQQLAPTRADSQWDGVRLRTTRILEGSGCWERLGDREGQQWIIRKRRDIEGQLHLTKPPYAPGSTPTGIASTEWTTRASALAVGLAGRPALARRGHEVAGIRNPAAGEDLLDPHLRPDNLSAQHAPSRSARAGAHGLGQDCSKPGSLPARPPQFVTSTLRVVGSTPILWCSCQDPSSTAASTRFHLAGQQRQHGVSDDTRVS